MSLRQERVNRFLLQEISEIVMRMKDPRLGFLTVTEARVSPDLRTARVGVSVMGDETSKDQSIKVLEAATGHIRKELSKHAHLKTVPALEFYLDEGAMHAIKIQELLKQIEDEQTNPSDA